MPQNICLFITHMLKFGAFVLAFNQKSILWDGEEGSEGRGICYPISSYNFCMNITTREFFLHVSQIFFAECHIVVCV